MHLKQHIKTVNDNYRVLLAYKVEFSGLALFQMAEGPNFGRLG